MAGDRRFIPITAPSLDEREADAARRPILSGWVTQGPEVGAFEKEFAQHVGATHACAVSNCTTALHLALLAVGVKDGDEVITASHSFIASANSIRYCGARPVFVDIEPGTYNINPALIERALTSRTRAILCVHQIGMPCNVEAIVDIARRRRLPVIEDAACAIGSELQWRGRWERIGKPHADIACFSFHPRKVITTGDGGMLTTASDEWDRQFRLWRHHGMSVSDAVRHAANEVVNESYSVLGYNYRMTDIQAAVGREQLKRLPELVARRRFLADRYKSLLANVSGVCAPAEPAWARSNWQSYCVRLRDKYDQHAVMQTMLNLGVATRRGVMSTHRERAYTDVYGTTSLPESESASDHCILIPLYPRMAEADQDHVIDALRTALA